MASVNNDPAPKQPKILLVDDREDNLLAIEAVLSPVGYQFYKAHSGKEALKILLEEIDFAMILMDVKMPILNGFETAALIQEREKLRDIPIIFITANNYGDDNVFKGYETGGIDYILKPINPEVLRAKVSTFINLYTKNRLLAEQERKVIAINEVLENEIKDRKDSEEKVRQLNEDLRKQIAILEAINKDLRHFADTSVCKLKDSIQEILNTTDALLTQSPQVDHIEVKLINLKKTAVRIQDVVSEMLAHSETPPDQESSVKNNSVPNK